MCGTSARPRCGARTSQARGEGAARPDRAVARAIDLLGLKGLVGSVAGDDTVPDLAALVREYITSGEPVASSLLAGADVAVAQGEGLLADLAQLQAAK